MENQSISACIKRYILRIYFSSRIIEHYNEIVKFILLRHRHPKLFNNGAQKKSSPKRGPKIHFLKDQHYPEFSHEIHVSFPSRSQSHA